jgi:branched-subunit amino acid transport protein AzlD
MNEWKANISKQTLRFNQVTKLRAILGHLFLKINVLLEIFLGGNCYFKN